MLICCIFIFSITKQINSLAFLTAGTLIKTPLGYLKVENLIQGDTILSFNLKTKSEQNSSIKKIFKINYIDGCLYFGVLKKIYILENCDKPKDHDSIPLLSEVEVLNLNFMRWFKVQDLIPGQKILSSHLSREIILNSIIDLALVNKDFKDIATFQDIYVVEVAYPYTISIGPFDVVIEASSLFCDEFNNKWNSILPSHLDH